MDLNKYCQFAQRKIFGRKAILEEWARQKIEDLHITNLLSKTVPVNQKVEY